MDENQVVEQLEKRFSQLEDRREYFSTTWEEIGTYVIPRRANLDFDESRRGEKRTEEIYDSTAQQALVLLADGLQGYCTSPTTTWFNLKFENERIMEKKAVRLWIQEVERVLYGILRRSNFYETISETFMDGGSLGTATMYIEEMLERKSINFRSMHPKEIYIAENIYGQVDTVFRKFYLLNKDALKYFGEDKFDERDVKTMKDQPYEQDIYKHAVFPREDFDRGKKDAKNKPFASYYWKDNGTRLLKEGGYDENPYVVWRWRTNTEEEYGRSPAWDALSDIKRSQEMSKTITKIAQLQVEPPLNYPSEQQGQIQIKPRGMNPYSNPERQVFPMNIGGNYPVGRDREEAIERSIREHFKVDFFLMLSQMQQQDMTATQVMEMQGEKAAVLGAIVGRLNSELLDPIFDRCFGIAYRNGWLPQIPPEIQGGETKLEIEYVGPLAQAQRRYYQTQGVNQALAQLLPLIEVAPNIRHRVNWDQLAKHLLVSNGMKESLINSDDEVAQIIQRERQQQQQLQQMQMAKDASEIYQKTAEKGEGMSAQAQGAL
jgi:hypothetical protein